MHRPVRGHHAASDHPPRQPGPTLSAVPRLRLSLVDPETTGGTMSDDTPINVDEFKEAVRPLRQALARLPENDAAEKARDTLDDLRDHAIESIETGPKKSPIVTTAFSVGGDGRLRWHPWAQDDEQTTYGSSAD